MKEIFFQDQTAKERNKRSLSLREIFTQGSCVHRAEIKTIFRLKEVRYFKDVAIAKEWVCNNMISADEHKRISILRISNTKSGKSLCQSKFVGVLYLISNNIVFTILFLHMLKIATHREF